MKLSFVPVLMLLFMTACGPKAKISPDYNNKKILSIAVLPPQASKDFRPQRISIFRAMLAQQFESRGFLVLDEKVLREECRDSECSNSIEIASRYGLDALVRTEMESTSQTDFGVGFYNEVSATLKVLDLNGSEIAQVSHTQSKRGGLLFQSGQVIQGLIEHYDNYGDDAYNKLAMRLARTLVSELPKMTSSSLTAEQINSKSKIVITRVDVDKVKDNVFKVCVTGTPSSLASLVIYKNKSNLREVYSGKYCGIFPLEKKYHQASNIELRSVFGGSVRQPLGLFNSRLM